MTEPKVSLPYDEYVRLSELEIAAAQVEKHRTCNCAKCCLAGKDIWDAMSGCHTPERCEKAGIHGWSMTRPKTEGDKVRETWTLKQKYTEAHEALRTIWSSSKRSVLTAKQLGNIAREALDRVDGRDTALDSELELEHLQDRVVELTNARYELGHALRNMYDFINESMMFGRSEDVEPLWAAKRALRTWGVGPDRVFGDDLEPA